MIAHGNFHDRISALARGLLFLAVRNHAQAKIDRHNTGLNAALANSLAPALLPVADVAGLPRILIIGDSISIGYTREMRQHFTGRTNVHWPPDNCAPTASTPSPSRTRSSCGPRTSCSPRKGVRHWGTM